ncbi:nuclear transport factor 2 family protein [Streptomyces sp. NBC_00683]|uniref:nuclear transport factor 2 family protein n=1 Tax=Streptomyces sp. NBC_00683 TaxID=2903670 RepID=UPI002E35DCB9|nr:nuclear transport factor 2 family protein [Streptomyces sp. NBC_00683]
MNAIDSRDFSEFARRYVAMWNEPDAALRHATVDALFASGGSHYTPTREFHGHHALRSRVTEGYEQWVEPGTHVFRLVPGADGHHGTVRFNWEMVETGSGRTAAVGFDFVVLDEDGLIISDHQFVDR